MKETPSKEHNYAFVDSQNLNLAVRGLGWHLDFGRFRKYMQDKFFVTKAYLFLGFVATNENMYTRLQEQGYILIFKPTLVLPGGKVKGNVDAELVLHTMIELPNYDRAVIVSGDGDFYCLADYLKSEGKLKKLIIPNKGRFSSLLRKFIPEYTVFVSDLRNKLEYRGAKK